jgi:hypothetical protein
MKKVGIVKVLFSEQLLAKCPKSTDLCDQVRYEFDFSDAESPRLVDQAFLSELSSLLSAALRPALHGPCTGLTIIPEEHQNHDSLFTCQ